jgi:predicted transposase YdaD
MSIENWASATIEQNDLYSHRNQLNGSQVNRVYLDELGDIRQLPLWVALMVLTTIEEEEVPREARYLLERSSVEQPETTSRAISEFYWRERCEHLPRGNFPNNASMPGNGEGIVEERRE